MENEFEKNIKTVIETLIQNLQSKGEIRYQPEFDALKGLYEANRRDFWNSIEIGQHEFERLVASILQIPPQKNVYIVEHIVSGLYEHFIKKLIEKSESSMCSSDKSGFIKSMTINALEKNKNLSLYADYTNVDRITEDKGKQAYWSPRTIKDTDTAMNLFWDWYLLRDKIDVMDAKEIE